MRFWLGVAVLLFTTVLAFLFAFNEPEDSIAFGLALTWSLKWAGAATALVSMIGLLHHWWDQSPVNQLPPSLLPFLAGVTLYTQHWGAAIAVGIVAVSLTARLWRRRASARWQVRGQPRPSGSNTVGGANLLNPRVS